jgi:hypothetical protein
VRARARACVRACVFLLKVSIIGSEIRYNMSNGEVLRPVTPVGFDLCMALEFYLFIMHVSRNEPRTAGKQYYSIKAGLENGPTDYRVVSL